MAWKTVGVVAVAVAGAGCGEQLGTDVRYLGGKVLSHPFVAEIGRGAGPAGIELVLLDGDARRELCPGSYQSGEITAAVSGDRARIDLCGDPDVWIELAMDGGDIDCVVHMFDVDAECLARPIEEATYRRVLHRPQHPAPPFPYQTREVVFARTDGRDGLHGTLVVPDGPGLYPAAILLSGSDIDDRDYTSDNHRPYLVLADHLARRGVATLRWDDRTRGWPHRPDPLGHPQLVHDAVAAIHVLRGDPRVDPSRIGIVGHSEGGLLAVHVAALEPDLVGFVVLLGAPLLPGERVIRDQVKYLHGGTDADADALLRAYEIRRQGQAASAGDADAARWLASACAGNERHRYGMDVVLACGEATRGRPSRDVAERDIDLYTSRPAEILPGVRCPVLAVGGQLDRHVLSAPNLGELERVLEDAGHPDVTTVILPSLDHGFRRVTARFGGPAQSETISPALLGVVADWLADRVRQPPAHLTERPLQ